MDLKKKKKIKYVKIDEGSLDPAPKKKKKKKSRVASNIGHALTVIGTTFASMLLILIIAGCIVATILSVYVLEFANESYDANLRDVELKYTSFVYAYDEEGKEVEIKRLAADENRVWVDIDGISQNMLDAVVATEDQRFYEHEGVDWKRTVWALMSDVFNTSAAGQGGSTITQQLVKDITGDNEATWERKLREIFRAMSLEEKYTKIDILESYLNRIWFGGMNYGISAATAYYFDKTPDQLTIAESAIIAGLIRSPGSYSPYVNLEKCKIRQTYALDCMYDQGIINTKEYNDALEEKVKFRKPVKGDWFGYIDERYYAKDEEEEDETEDETVESGYEAYKWNGDYEVTQNWYVDAAIEDVINDYADLKGISYTSAKNEIYNGGYKLYLNMDMKLQNILEEKFRDPYIALSKYDATAPKEDLLQTAFVLMDYMGTVVGVVGGLGEKEGDGVFNRATMATRAPGSTIKPISVYSTAIEQNLIYYSMMIPDLSIMEMPDPDSDDPEAKKMWPENYEGSGGKGALTPIYEGVRTSMNTIATRVCDMLTPRACYNQLTQKLFFSTITENDIAYSPIALGALSTGVRIVELAAAYQIFGNGGVYYEPMLYSKVTDANDRVVLEQQYIGIQAISKDTAWVTNRILQKVVTGGIGSTGRYAQLENCEVIGKTGTSNDECNLLFVGCTPDYVGAYWLGYDDNRKISKSDGWRTIAQVWHDVMVDIQDSTEMHTFTPDSTVLELSYCTETGLLATSRCPNTEIGYYRHDNKPGSCTMHHDGSDEKATANDYYANGGREKIDQYGNEIVETTEEADNHDERD